MELLKELPSKSWTTATGRKTSERFAIFKCNYCNKEVEKRRSKGIAQKSCGEPECQRQAQSDGYNRELSAKNRGNLKDNRSNMPYYSTFKMIYSSNKIKLQDAGVEDFDLFYKTVYQNYSKLRENNTTIHIDVINQNIKIWGVDSEKKNDLESSLDSKVDLIKKAELDLKKYKDKINLRIEEYGKDTFLQISNILSQNKYSSILLEKITDIKYKTINLKIETQIKEMHIDFIDAPEKVSIGKRYAFILNEDQYNSILSLLPKGRMKKSSSVYIIKAKDNQYKIGISSDSENRFTQIKAMNPPSSKLELIYSKYTGPIACMIENQIHNKLKKLNLHLHFEWFYLDESMLKTVIHTIENHEKFLFKIEKEKEEEISKTRVLRLKRLVEKKEAEIKNRILKINSDIENNNKLFAEKKDDYSGIIIERGTILTAKNDIKVKQDIEKEIKKKIVREKTKRTDYKQATRHGLTDTPIYLAWISMKQRAKNEDTFMEPVWIESFEAWLEDLGEPEDSILVLARLNMKNGFRKSNLKWMTIAEQRGLSRAREIIQIDSNTGSELSKYVSAADAAIQVDKATAGHITACCRGKRKSHAGYIWKYAA